MCVSVHNSSLNLNNLSKTVMKKTILGLSLIIGALLVGCTTAKKVPYIVDAETIPAEILNQVQPAAEPRFAPGDLLNIIVTTTSTQAAMPFNKGVMVDYDGQVGSSTTTRTNSNDASIYNYLVDSHGYIDFPILGPIHIAGMTKSEAVEKLQRELWPKYLTEKPAIDMRLTNFHVYMLGQVGTGVVRAENERLNILEAISMCGDLGIQGRRDNVMLIRTNYDGTREIVRLDLQDKNLLISPYFQLQQNDMIYVEPNKTAADGSWALPKAFSTTLSIVGGASSIIGLGLTIANLVKK